MVTITMMNGARQVMAENTQITKVKESVAQANGWPLHEIEVAEVHGLRQAGCTFYRAYNPEYMDLAPTDRAVLPDGQVAEDAAEVLRECGTDAPAAWWAGVVDRLGGVPGLLVDAHAPSAIRKIRAAGGDWTPSLEVHADGATVDFFTVDYEASAVFQVKATLPREGALIVEQRGL